MNPDTQHTLPLLVGAEALGKLLSVSKATVWRMEAAGKLPRPVRINGNNTRWRTDEIRAWIDAGCPARCEWDAMQAAETVTRRPARNGRPSFRPQQG